jgi:TRAP-type mannitol/chloroaromatic compound transport system substrate-binding protein
MGGNDEKESTRGGRGPCSCEHCGNCTNRTRNDFGIRQKLANPWYSGDVWEDLSDTAKTQIEVACLANITTNLAEGEATNYAAMVENTEENGVIIKQWAPEMLEAFEGAWNEVVVELADGDAFFQEVWADLQDYRKGYAIWNQNIYLPRK